MAPQRHPDEPYRSSPDPLHPARAGPTETNMSTRSYAANSWIEVSSQPSSSSLSSIAENAPSSRTHHDPRNPRRKRTVGRGSIHGQQGPSTTRENNGKGSSSQEEYSESSSESDHILSSSGEGLPNIPTIHYNTNQPPQLQRGSSYSSVPFSSSSDDENRTAVNHPLSSHRRDRNNEACFTPQPNAFSHPPSASHMRNASQPAPGSYFSYQTTSRPAPRQQKQQDISSHAPPPFQAAARHDEALRASLSTLLSCAAAARGLSKSQTAPNSKEDSLKRPPTTTTTSAAQPHAQRSRNQIDPTSLRLVPESALPGARNRQPQPKANNLGEPIFSPTLRRTSTPSSPSSPQPSNAVHPKRKSQPRTSSRPKRRRSRPHSPSSRSSSLSLSSQTQQNPNNSSNFNSSDPVTPTLLTWVLSAGVVVVFSALSFGAGFAMGRESNGAEAGNCGFWEGGDEHSAVVAKCRWGLLGEKTTLTSLFTPPQTA
ncbi:hypothetical protein MBLNU230_g5296t1 [Neophaeotheca triangularis]